MTDNHFVSMVPSAEKAALPVSTGTKPDYRLILSSLERKILNDEEPEKTRRILSTSTIWRDLSARQQCHWAALAQMAGEMETALNVLSSVNRIAPDNVRAWRDRLDLLLVLDRREEAAKTMAMARNHMDGQALAELPEIALRQPAETPAAEADFTEGAFDRFRTRERRIGRYMSLFSGRGEAFARQWADRRKSTQGYIPVRRPITPMDIEDHVKGRFTYGIYLLRSDSTVTLGVIDADLTAEYRKSRLSSEQRQRVYRERAYMLSRIAALSSEKKFSFLVEFSGGKGYHFWYFLDQPVSAARIRVLLDGIANRVAPDLSVFSLEVFPKQDRLGGKGFGNLVKLPLGIHRATGKSSSFLHCKDKRTDAQLAFLDGVKSTSVEDLAMVEKSSAAEKVVAHPRWQRWSEQFPELHALESKCAPLGGIIALCREGKKPAIKEERILFQTIGFLPRAKTLLHHLYAFTTDYNPHWVDFKLSRVRGTPLGCRRIHALVADVGDMCAFDRISSYPHPLLHIDTPDGGYREKRSEKVENLNDALDNLQTAMDQVLTFIK